MITIEIKEGEKLFEKQLAESFFLDWNKKQGKEELADPKHFFEEIWKDEEARWEWLGYCKIWNSIQDYFSGKIECTNIKKCKKGIKITGVFWEGEKYITYPNIATITKNIVTLKWNMEKEFCKETKYISKFYNTENFEIIKKAEKKAEEKQEEKQKEKQEKKAEEKQEEKTEWISVAEAAKTAGKAERTVQTWAKKQIVKARKINKKWNIEKNSLLAYIKQAKEQTKKKKAKNKVKTRRERTEEEKKRDEKYNKMTEEEKEEYNKKEIEKINKKMQEELEKAAQKLAQTEEERKEEEIIEKRNLQERINFLEEENKRFKLILDSLNKRIIKLERKKAEEKAEEKVEEKPEEKVEEKVEEKPEEKVEEKAEEKPEEKVEYKFEFEATCDTRKAKPYVAQITLKDNKLDRYFFPKDSSYGGGDVTVTCDYSACEGDIIETQEGGSWKNKYRSMFIIQKDGEVFCLGNPTKDSTIKCNVKKYLKGKISSDELIEMYSS